MAKKNQEVTKALKKLAEDIDNVGLKDSDAWQRLSGEFENAIKPAKHKFRYMRPATYRK